MKLRAMFAIGSVALGLFALLIVLVVNEYIYSVEEYAFKPLEPQPQEGGIEHYVADIAGGKYTGKDGSVPVFFCKYGNMVAVNVVGFEKPWLWKTGNKVVVLTGDEGDSPHKAHSECLIVVMDADEGEMLVARPTADDIKAIGGMRRVEVEDHVVSCYNEAGECHEIRVQVRHRSSALAKIWGRHLISSAVRRACSRYEDECRKWVDPATGLEWMYVEMADGVMIENTRTRGCAVSPKPKGVAVIPEYIDGKPVKCIGDNVIINCDVATVRIPKTVERFSERAPFSLNSSRLNRIEVDSENRMFQARDGLLYDITGKILLRVPPSVSDVQIPEGVTNIAESAFDRCYPLDMVTIPVSVEVLGEWVFFMSSVKKVRFLGDAPNVPKAELKGIYNMTPTALTTYARKDAKGWLVNGELPMTWCDRKIVFE
jgi:hypothetical protein